MIQRRSTKQILAESYIELSYYRPIEKITVGDIIENCGMARQTFYYHFPTKYDLVIWIFAHATDRILDEHITKEPWGISMGRVLEMIASNWSFYRKALRRRDDNLFFSSFYRYCVDYYRRKLKELYHLETLDADLLFEIRFNCHGSTNITRDWLEGDLSGRSPQSIGALMYESMPTRLKAYFSF